VHDGGDLNEIRIAEGETALEDAGISGNQAGAVAGDGE